MGKAKTTTKKPTRAHVGPTDIVVPPKVPVMVGLDNGLKGGGCVVDMRDGKPLFIFRNPTKDFVIENASRSDTLKGMLDGGALYEMFKRLSSTNPIVIVGERPLLHAQSSAAIRSMWHSYGAMEMLGVHWPWHPIDVKNWQRPMLGKVSKRKTKARALEVANRLAPGFNWVPLRCRVEHDGVVDGFLIARYVLKHKPELI